MSLIKAAPRFGAFGAQTVRHLRVSGCTAQVSYSKTIVPTAVENAILNTSTHPLRAQVLEGIAARPKDILHWTVWTQPSIKILPKAVLRSKLQARWETAFRTALLQNGYATNGYDLTATPVRPGLKGILEIKITRAQGMTATNEELVDQCSNVIIALER
jgi:hypothetical protein